MKSIEVESTHRRVHRQGRENCGVGEGGFVDEIKVRILVEGALSGDQVERIRHIAGRCPVSRTIEAKPTILHEVEVVE